MNVPAEYLNMLIYGIVGVCVWVFRDKTKKYDKHLEECNGRRETEAALAATVSERICVIETNSNRNRKEISWLGDCMVRVGTKLDVPLDKRPD